jgi:aryl-alcohol dehydrogenase-like predicted oxidoreductase
MLIDEVCMSKSKLVLGTAQFGFDYGINNTRGKIPRAHVFEILNHALISGIDIIDTAHIYGDSEIVIGEYMNKSNGNFKIISKLPHCKPREVKDFFNNSLERLRIDSLYGYYIHSFLNYMENPEIWEMLEEMKACGKIEKIGFSLYYPFELEYILENNINLDIIQIPYSVFDQRFKTYFPILKTKKIEVYARSIFLQGLGFKDPHELKGNFEKMKDKLSGLHSISKETNIPIASLLLNFVTLDNYVDRVVIGVDNLENLKEIVELYTYKDKVLPLIEKLASLKEDDEIIILPLNWK